MELWSDGRETVVYDDAGLTFFDGAAVAHICSVTGDPVSLNARKGLYSSKRRLFTVNPATRTALVGDLGEVPYLFDLNTRQPIRRLSFRWLNATHLRDDRYLAVLPEDEKQYIRFVRLSRAGDILEELAPPAVPLTPADAEMVSQGTRPPRESILEVTGPFACQRGRSGVALADQSTGMIFVAPSDEPELSVALQLPVVEDLALLPCALERGCCVGMAVRENHSALAAYGFDGSQRFDVRTLNRALFTGGGMPFAPDDETIVWPHSTSGGVLATFSSATGELQHVSPIPGGSVYFHSVVPFADDEAFLVSRATVVRVTREAEGKWRGEVLERKAIPKRITEHHAPISGPPSVHLKPLEAQWEVRVGATAGLRFAVANSGGAASGIVIELSGDPLTKNAIRPREARLGRTVVPFELSADKAVARFDEVAVPAAVEKGTKRTKVHASELEPLEVSLEGLSPASGFLMVRVRCASATSASGKQLVVVG